MNRLEDRAAETYRRKVGHTVTGIVVLALVSLPIVMLWVLCLHWVL